MTKRHGWICGIRYGLSRSVVVRRGALGIWCMALWRLAFGTPLRIYWFDGDGLAEVVAMYQGALQVAERAKSTRFQGMQIDWTLN